MAADKPTTKDATPTEADMEVKTDDKTADVGTPNPPSMRDLAEDLPEKDDVQKATKAAYLADSAQAEAQEKVKVVEASPNADETPSGIALQKSAGVENDTERGEVYAREKTAVRWGYVPVEADKKD